MTQTESPSIADAWSENPVATAAAVALGIVIGAGAVIGYFSIMATGDEPPIRVRNGSIELEVLHKSRYWKERQCRHSLEDQSGDEADRQVLDVPCADQYGGLQRGQSQRRRDQVHPER